MLQNTHADGTERALEASNLMVSTHKQALEDLESSWQNRMREALEASAVELATAVASVTADARLEVAKMAQERDSLLNRMAAEHASDLEELEARHQTKVRPTLDGAPNKKVRLP